MSNSITKYLLLSCILYLSLTVIFSLIQASIDLQPTEETKTLLTAAPIAKSASLAGSYRLRLPLTPFRIRNHILVIQLCNTHAFRIKLTKGTDKITLTLVSSTEMACKDENDKQFIDLLTQATSYKLDGTLYFYKGKEILAKAQRNKGYRLLDGRLEGQWNLEIINLALEVSDTEFSFLGCNNNIFKYQTTENGKIALKFIGRTEKACNVDTDEIFTFAL